jgi:undecaprenyl-diphosphatase
LRRNWEQRARYIRTHIGERTTKLSRFLLFPIGILSLVLYFELGLIAKSGPLPIDTRVALWFKSHRTPAELHWAQILSAITTPIIVFSVMVLLLLFLNYWTRSWYLRDYVPLALLATAAILSTLSKPFFDRTRPGSGLATLFDFEPSYPSSHAVFIAAAGSAFILMAGRHQYLTLNLMGFATILIGVVRLTLGLHWFTDVLGSAFLSFGLLVIFYGIDDWLAERESSRP